MREITPGGSAPGLGARRNTYNHAGYLVRVETHDGTGYQTRAEMGYDGLGQRLTQTVWDGSLSLTTNYVLDPLAGARPLSASVSGQTTRYLYGLGPIAEKAALWSYYLPDGMSTVRQLSDNAGEVTLYRGFTPWGEVLEQVGAGDFALGYLGGMLDAATGLIYVGGGQYYDPATGRFLTRQAQPGKPNPYTPWRGNPLGALLGPAALILIIRRRGKKPGKADRILIGLVLLLGVGAGLAACDDGSPGFPYTPEPPSIQPLPDTPIIDMPWVDEMDWSYWVEYPNSCGAAALSMFLQAEGRTVDFHVLVEQLQGERSGGYDPYCCKYDPDRWPKEIPSPTPGDWCNKACVSAETLADVARKYYGLSIESGDNWTKKNVHEKLMSGHPALALIRVNLSTDSFGHFVVIRGFVDQGAKVVFNDSYPGEGYWGSPPDERRAAGEKRHEDWYKFDISWASYIDAGMDPLASGGHVRWAMAVR